MALFRPLRVSLLVSVVALVALCLTAGEAWATQQMEEELAIDGLVHRMQATPLEPYLDALPKRPDFGAPCSALWRGYIGTWTIEDGVLYLAKLRRWASGAAETAPEGEDDPSVPLSFVFGDRKGPIPATWFSGLLRIPQGRRIQYVHMGFGTLYEQTIFLRVRKGRVEKRWVVDNLREGAIRSRKDMQWVAIVDEPLPDDGKWHDARSIESAEFAKRVGADKRFRTRGVIVSDAKTSELSLWIPATQVTSQVRIPLRGATKPERSFAHAALTVSWAEHGGRRVLDVHDLRLLKPGETIHHAKFDVPDLEEKLRTLAAKPDEDPGGIYINEARELGYLHGWHLELSGPLRKENVATIHGVEVDGGAAKVGETATATGLLQRWYVTKRLLETNETARGLFGERGPGTYFRLVDPKTDAPARATK